MQKILLGIFILLNIQVQAGGFEFPIHSVKLAGIGNAGNALAWDAGCLQFNSANMAFLDTKMSVVLGGNSLLANIVYQNKGTQTTQYNKSELAFIPNVFLTYKVNEKFSAGFNLTFNYGSKTDWGNDFELSAVASYLSLSTAVPTFHGSYKLNDNFSIGANVALSYLSAEFTRVLREVPFAINPQNPPSLNIKCVGLGWEAGAGISFQSNDKTWLASLEYKYSADVNSDIDGKAELENVPNAYTSSIPNGNIMTTIYMPQRVSIGLSKKIEQLTLALSATLYDWSRMKQIKIQFLDENFKEGKNSTSTYDINFKQVIHLNIGVQYEIEKIAFRAGMSYSNTATNKDYVSPLLPLDDQITTHIGLSYKVHKNIDVDFCYLYSYGLGFEGQHKTLGISEAKFRTLINTLGLGLNYHL